MKSALPEKQNQGVSPRVWGLILGLSAVVIFFTLVALGEAERGKIAAFSFFAISISLRIRWEQRHDSLFWPSVLAITFAHLLVIVLVDWIPERNPAIIFAPFTILDIFLIVWALRPRSKIE